MTLYALEAIDDALDATTAFLTPVEPRTWLKLALVAFFVGIPGANPSGFQFSASGPGPGNGRTGFPDGITVGDLGPRFWVVAVAIVVAVIAVGLLFVLVGSIMEFVFVESLRTRTVSIREHWRQRWRQGLRLFGFRVLLGALAIGPVLAVVGFVAVGGFDTLVVSRTAGILAAVLLVPAYLVFVAVLAVINGFTTVFGVPIMILDDTGVLDAWRRLWPSIRADPGQYLAYLVASIILGVIGSFAVGIATVVVALLLLVPFGVLFGVGFAFLAILPPVGVAILVLVGLLFAFVALTIAATASVPVLSYLRYYALLVLGDVDTDLDLIPDQREEIRSPPGDDPTTPDSTGS